MQGAVDSALEVDGFELSVPRVKILTTQRARQAGCDRGWAEASGPRRSVVKLPGKSRPRLVSKHGRTNELRESDAGIGGFLIEQRAPADVSRKRNAADTLHTSHSRC